MKNKVTCSGHAFKLILIQLIYNIGIMSVYSLIHLEA